MLNILCKLFMYFCFAHGYLVDSFNNEYTTEMIEDGKNQYQLLQERGRLPHYGECWTSAVEHIHEGCRYLTEDIQSDIALRITNCFLAMSGHETYNCDLDKKPNLRGICISSMTDRAFNVYTEFYTHAQNICWFLRGQIWQEKINERTFQVGEQLKKSAVQQEVLLMQQKESLTIQEQLLNYGRNLENVLNKSVVQVGHVMEQIKTSSFQHQQLLSRMTESLNGLQSWLIGEISWFDSLVFYVGAGLITILITSTARTSRSRLPIFFCLSLNILLERFVINQINTDIDYTQIWIHDPKYLHGIIWFCRRFTVVISILAVLIVAYFHRDYATVNNNLLLKIQQQNLLIQEGIEKLQLSKFSSNKVDNSRESSVLRHSVETEIVKPVVNYYKPFSETYSDSSTSKASDTNNLRFNYGRFVADRSSVTPDRISSFKESINHYLHHSSQSSLNNNLSTDSARRYNLRSRTETPILKDKI